MLVLHLGGLWGLVRWPGVPGVLGQVQVRDACPQTGSGPSRSEAGDRPRGDPEIVRIRFRDGPGPALLARSVWDEASKLEGDTGARALFDAHPERVLWVAVDEDAPVDVDREADLGRA